VADDGRLTRLIRFIADKVSLEGVKSEARRALDEGTKPPTRNFRAVESGLARIRRAAVAVGGALAAAFGARAFARFLSESVRMSQQVAADMRALEVQVRNTGVAFEDAKTPIDRVLASLWETHRVTVSSATPALTTLIGVTNDWAGSLLNIGLVADVAAGANMDLQAAAKLVGRVMLGDTTMLRRYGIVVREGADALQVMRERFDGLSKATSTPIANLSKQWADFKEELGATIALMTGNESALDGLTAAVRASTMWLARNKDEIGKFAREIGGALAFVARALHAFATPFRFVFSTLIYGVANWRDLTTLAIANVGIAFAQFLQGMERDIARVAARFRITLAPSQRLEEMRSGWEQIRHEARRGLLRTAEEVDKGDPFAGLVAGPTGINAVAETFADAVKRMTDEAKVLGRGIEMGLADPAQKQRLVAVYDALTDAMRRATLEQRIQITETLNAVQDAYDRLTFAPRIGLAVPGRDSGFISTMLPSVENTRQTFDVLTDIMRERLDVWASVAQTAASNFSAAWEDAFTLLMRDMGSLADFGEKVARGLAAGFLGALAQYAQSKVAENIALAAENAAKGLAASVTPGMQAAAAGFYGAAKGNIGAAALWGVLAGGSGGASNAVGGSGSAPAGGTVAASRVDPFAQGGRGEVHVYIDAFDPSNPVHYKAVGQAVRNVAQTSGRDVIVHRGRQR